MYILDYIRQILCNGKKDAKFYSEGLKKPFGDPTPLEVALYDGNQPLDNVDIGIEINKKQYIKKTDNNGIARLNINLPAGEYQADLYYPGSNEYNKVASYVKVYITAETYIDGINLTKNFGDPEPYQCAVYRKDTNERVAGEVELVINGRSYNRTSDEEGLYKLNINLNVGTYNIQANFKGTDEFNPSFINNTITINPKVETFTSTPISTGKKTIVLGCDSNTSNDAAVQARIRERLEAEGYPVEILPIGPNFFATCDYSSNAKGKIGIYLIASGIFSIADAYYGSGQFDNYVFGIRGDFGDKGAVDFNRPIRADADCTSICNDLDRKTFNQMNAMLQPYVAICGGAEPNELADNIINWLRALENRNEQPASEPEQPQSSYSGGLNEYFTNQGGGYLGQKTGYTCGPHSLMQCIYRLTGEDVSEMTLASVCGTTTDGTDHDGLATGLAWFNREYGYNLKMEWKNFSEVGFDGTQDAINNGACFHHILYRNQWGHYEVPKWTAGDPIYVLNSLGDSCSNGYCGYVEERSRSTHQSYINGISQKSVCIITRG